MAEYPIKVESLVKYFDGRCVLDGINLNVPQGCIYGLLGRNGTGKTTIIRILLGLDFPTRGRTSLLGVESSRLTPELKGRIGYVAEAHNLIQNYRVGRLIKLCKDLSRKWNDAFFSHLIETFRLPMHRSVRQLSVGMRAQLNLSLAMAIDPELLILDDPTLGLDTVARRQFLELAVDLLGKDGRTILFSSHILSDVERIADRVGILAGGKLVVDCPLEELKKRVKKLRLIFAQAAPADLHLTEIISRQLDDRELTITVANWSSQKRALVETFKPESCTEIPMSLEDIFIECTKPISGPITAASKEA
jgi:ABC-2 type transport system ATP-binding protein